MQLNHPMAIAEAARYAKTDAEQRASGLHRYRAGRHPEKRGYTVFDAVARYSLGDDVEGVGWIWWSAPRRQPPYVGWYKFKRDAEARAAALNASREKEGKQ